MAYDTGLAQRVRDILTRTEQQYPFVEKRMFGGLAFMVRGHMCCGVHEDRLMLRQGNEGAVEALKQDGARPMDFTGRPMKSMVFVDADAAQEDDDLEEWVRRGIGFVTTLPPK